MSVVIAAGVVNTNLPRIGWRAIEGDVDASSEAAGFNAELAAQPQTYTAWKPSAMPATWEIDAGEPVGVDYCAIGAHEIGSNGGTVFVEYEDGGWQTVLELTPDDDTAILFLFPEIEAQEWRIRVTGAMEPRIGNIRFGKVTTLPRQSTFAPELPITEAEQFTYNVNLSTTGEWLGRSVVASGLEFSVTVDHVPETFAAGEWADFRRHCNEGEATFYIATKPQAYPREVAYAWPLETVRAQRAIPNKAISRRIELQCGGYKKP